MLMLQIAQRFPFVILKIAAFFSIILITDNASAYYMQKIDDVWWKYTIENNEISLGVEPSYVNSTPPCIPISTSGELAIPREIGNLPVTRIGTAAFCGCTNLTGVTIPDSITRIDSWAFGDCSRLANIEIPDSVTNIWNSAFHYCTSLTNVIIGMRVKYIGSGAFAGCRALQNVKIPNSVIGIGNGAFYSCNITNVIIGSSVKSIGEPGDLAFQSHVMQSFNVAQDNEYYGSLNGLLLSKDGTCLILGVNKNVTIPDSVTNIEDSAFDGCWGMTHITIPIKVKKIGRRTFYNCMNLKSITFHGNAPEVSVGAFDYVATGCIAYVKRTASEWPEEGEAWNGLSIACYGFKSDKATIKESKSAYVLVTNDGEILTESDVTVSAVVGGVLVDTTKGYGVKVTADGNSATMQLKKPTFGAAAVAKDGNPPTPDENDPTGALVVVDESKLAAIPVAMDGEAIGALPVASMPGLYYQAAWGNDLGSLTTGAKIQATTDRLYLGVIKQMDMRGFYSITVSEQ